jgi:hypothetical protein
VLQLSVLFERQRLLLALLEALGEPVGNTDFQKLLFLYSQECEKQPSYEFVPYKFGGFSFTSYADKRRLIEQGLLQDDDQEWKLTGSGRTLAARQAVNRPGIAAFCRKYDLRGYELLTEAYRRYPYYAIRSEIIHKLQLDSEILEAIRAARPAQQSPGLLTIGYEGKTFEAYLNQLLRANVTLLCDVRRNPLSRKYGFSKATLSNACYGLNIQYEHVPELGIPSESRRNLQGKEEYDRLFKIYARESLPREVNTLKRILSWIEQGERVALTCFERLPELCHRHCVAKELERIGGIRLGAVHL